jgi:uncharacterized protein (TIGR02757 family)
VNLKAILEAAYADYHSQQSLEKDPISLVHAFPDPRDKEIAGFICALIAYGNVATILKGANALLEPLRPSPYQTLSRYSKPLSLPDFKHRFTVGVDFEIVFHWIHRALVDHPTLESFFVAGKPASTPMKELLSSFVKRFTALSLPPELQDARVKRQRQLKYLISDPARGSACKRLNMFLRWMVRPSDGIDLGLWKSISPASLILPLDTHVLQTIGQLGWATSEQATWKLAEKATLRLKKLCPEDPIRYDFSLCHLSMEGGKILHYKAPSARLE